MSREADDPRWRRSGLFVASGPDDHFEQDRSEEVGQKCRAHVMDAVKRGDAMHKAAVDKVMSASPTEQGAMMADYKSKFDAAPNV